MIPSYFKGGDLDDIVSRVETGERLTADDGARLLRSRDLAALGALAVFVKKKLHGNKACYSNYLNLNPTNVCVNECSLCSFYRKPGAPDAYALSRGEVRSRVQKAVGEYGVREVHIVGGLNDALAPEYYFDVLSWVKEYAGKIHVKAYTAVEIDYLAKRTGQGPEAVLHELRRRGLDSIPGGGAEIFSEAVRKKICPRKISGARWLEIHRIAHGLGIPSNATMLYGHVETAEDRVDHLLALRALQDETGKFNAFVPLAFRKADNGLGDSLLSCESDGITDLKVLAVSRLLLDNIPHIRVHWPAIGIRFAQAALSFGADDLGGTALEEKVLHEAGSPAPEPLTRDEMIRMIRSARCEPCETVSSYLSPENIREASAQQAR